MLPYPSAVLLVIREEGGTWLVKNEANSLWTLPGGIPWESCGDSLPDFARAWLYPYFDIKHLTLDLILASVDEIIIDGQSIRCTVFECMIEGKVKKDTLDKLWLAPKESLVTQVLSSDVICVLQHPDVQSRLG